MLSVEYISNIWTYLYFYKRNVKTIVMYFYQMLQILNIIALKHKNTLIIVENGK